jgi:hypothetical protein
MPSAIVIAQFADALILRTRATLLEQLVHSGLRPSRYLLPCGNKAKALTLPHVLHLLVFIIS